MPFASTAFKAGMIWSCTSPVASGFTRYVYGPDSVTKSGSAASAIHPGTLSNGNVNVPVLSETDTLPVPL